MQQEQLERNEQMDGDKGGKAISSVSISEIFWEKSNSCKESSNLILIKGARTFGEPCSSVVLPVFAMFSHKSSDYMQTFSD